MPSNHLILCHPLLLLPSIFPSIRVFSNESALHITWPKYWSFSFSISPSKECPGLISLDWTGWISLQSKGLSRFFSNTTVQTDYERNANLNYNLVSPHTSQNGHQDSLEKELAIHSSTIAWKILWTEEPGRLQSMGLQRVRHDWATSRSPTNNKCWRGHEEKGTLLNCWRKCKLVQSLWRTIWKFLKKLKIELLYDPSILLLGIYLGGKNIF